MLKSIDHFIEELKEFNPNNQNTMVSFNVVLLFTNVPLVETIEIIISWLYDEHNNNSIPISKDIFKKIMLLAIQGIFMRNEQLHKQVELIIMGNLLGLTMAIFFMAYLEEKIFAESLRDNFNLSFILDILMMCTRFLIATRIATSFFRFWTHSIKAWNLQRKKSQIHCLFLTWK